MSFVAVRLNAVSYPVETAESRELEQADAKIDRNRRPGTG